MVKLTDCTCIEERAKGYIYDGLLLKIDDLRKKGVDPWKVKLVLEHIYDTPTCV